MTLLVQEASFLSAVGHMYLPSPAKRSLARGDRGITRKLAIFSAQLGKLCTTRWVCRWINSETGE